MTARTQSAAVACRRPRKLSKSHPAGDVIPPRRTIAKPRCYRGCPAFVKIIPSQTITRRPSLPRPPPPVQFNLTSSGVRPRHPHGRASWAHAG